MNRPAPVGSPQGGRGLAGGWQGTPGTGIELTSLPQSQEMGRSPQRDSVSSINANQNAKETAPGSSHPFSDLCAQLCFPTTASGLGGRGQE